MRSQKFVGQWSSTLMISLTSFPNHVLREGSGLNGFKFKIWKILFCLSIENQWKEPNRMKPLQYPLDCAKIFTFFQHLIMSKTKTYQIVFCALYGGVQQCRSTTVPKKAGKFQNNFNAFSKEREITDANYQRKSLQFRRQKCLQLQV